METLLIGLGILGGTAAISGFLLFGIRPLPVTDPEEALGIPSAGLKETFGLERLRTTPGAKASLLVRCRSLLLIIFWLSATAAAAALVAAGIALVLGVAVSDALGA